MEQPSSGAVRLHQPDRRFGGTSPRPRGPHVRYNWPAVAGSLLRGDMPLRVVVAILIAAVTGARLSTRGTGRRGPRRWPRHRRWPPTRRVVSARVDVGRDPRVVAARTRADRDRRRGRWSARVAAVFDLRKVRTAQPYRFERTNDGADAPVRVRDRRRSIPPPQPRTSRRLAGDGAADPQDPAPGDRARHHRSASPVARRGGRRGRRDDRPHAGAGRHLRRRDRLQHRAAAGRSVRADRREAVSRRSTRSPATARSLAAEFNNAGRRVRAVRFTRRRWNARRTTTSGASRCGGSSWHRR